MFLKKRNNFINSQFKSKLSIKEILGTAESLMCDVIKIRLKEGKRGETEKTHDTFQIQSIPPIPFPKLKSNSLKPSLDLCKVP